MTFDASPHGGATAGIDPDEAFSADRPMGSSSLFEVALGVAATARKIHIFKMGTINQLSAPISRETREMLDRYTERTGIKKGHLIEEALRSYLIAHEGLPLDQIVPASIQLTSTSSRKFVRELRGLKPNAALKKLMRDGD